MPEGGHAASRLQPGRCRRFFPLALLALLAGCGGPTADRPAKPAPAPVTRVVLGGDVMLSRHVGRLSRFENDAAWPFRRLAPFLAGADLAFVNLESPFGRSGPRTDRGMIFKAEPEMIEGLKLAGIDIVSTANNHARDAGAEGVNYTLEWLAGHRIAAAGTGGDRAAAHQGAVLARNGVRFGFLAYTYDQKNGNYPHEDERVAMMDATAVRADVKKLTASADVVIVSMHAGREYEPQPTPSQAAFARAAIDAGASVVVGHHPHVPQPVEKYGGGVIFYSLGNLVFDQDHRPETRQGLLAEVRFRGASLEGYALRRVLIRRGQPFLEGKRPD